jgi:hypothetical protein
LLFTYLKREMSLKTGTPGKNIFTGVEVGRMENGLPDKSSG